MRVWLEGEPAATLLLHRVLQFWELDQNHDLLLEQDDLLKYGNKALSLAVVDRIMAEIPRSFTSGRPRTMSYQDFVWFILAEEDKTSDQAIEYWFKCLDIDGDGLVSVHEM